MDALINKRLVRFVAARLTTRSLFRDWSLEVSINLPVLICLLIKVHLGIDERGTSASVTKEISKLEGDPLATKRFPKKVGQCRKKIKGGGL